MGQLRRSTLDILEADEGEFGRICDRIAGRDPYYDAIDVDPRTGEAITTKQLPAPTEAIREMGYAVGAVREYIRRHPERRLNEAYQQALVDRGHVLAEQALTIADTVDEAQAAIAKARLRTDVRRWLARSYAPQTFANVEGTAQASVTVVFTPEDMRG